MSEPLALSQRQRLESPETSAPLGAFFERAARQDGARSIAVQGYLLGERLDTRAAESDGALGMAPAALSVPGGGIAVLFRYGVAVLFGAPANAAEQFLAALAPLVSDPLPVPGREEVQLIVRADADQPIDTAGNIMLREETIDRLQLVADVLAKNLVLADYETRIAAIFDRIEPLAATLRKSGRAGAGSRELLQQVGNVLAMQHKMVGRVESGEKPELLWDHPELERLYARLAEEYELRDRDRALDRKLDIISRTVETLLGLVQTRSSARVEWYIVLLIVAELLLAAYPLLLHR
jgi:required for meiotic nuclear division protein 1